MKPLDQMTTEEIDAEYDRLKAALDEGDPYVDVYLDGSVQLDGTFTLEELRTVVRMTELVAETRRRGST